ncbi:hypothetical protein NEOLEDRAFT_1135924 [Neolentinus lepideus HHB14362 ss-1]|uniref:Nucleosome assembly protein n=1 Tax=Neolentinus lepideus HHB14362 ss-1 TaxID=1314782 RepID=A0A165RGV9_9AGAM|nr:hypothetical protein NEOLEDRAFT_1135924 [Neolentinus lepideus HHB14362 ss-1]
MSKGTKRASPGTDVEKHPLADVELGDEEAAKLQAITKETSRVELLLERRAQEGLKPVYEKRRAVCKEIKKFWPVALMNSSMFAIHAQHHDDQVALSYLEDLWIVRDSKEPRVFTVEFYFKENPYFTDSVLKKEYKYIAPPAAANETPDEDGITDSVLDFSWERDVAPQAYKISWKDDSKNLTKLHPRERFDEEDDMPAEPGTFFHYFELAEDPFDIGVLIANDVFPEAIDYFLGNAGGDDMDDSEDEESGDSDEDEIDLEKPKPKKPRHA